jgi:putative transcriptional regulator
MRITIDKVLEKQGKSRYWLAKETNSNYQSLCKLCNNESSSITFDLLERICLALNCSPSDVLDIRH